MTTKRSWSWQLGEYPPPGKLRRGGSQQDIVGPWELPPGQQDIETYSHAKFVSHDFTRDSPMQHVIPEVASPEVASPEVCQKAERTMHTRMVVSNRIQVQLPGEYVCHTSWMEPATDSRGPTIQSNLRAVAKILPAGSKINVTTMETLEVPPPEGITSSPSHDLLRSKRNLPGGTTQLHKRLKDLGYFIPDRQSCPSRQRSQSEPKTPASLQFGSSGALQFFGER